MYWYLGYIALYFVLLFSVGFYYFRKVKTSEDYLISGWNEEFWPLVGTIVSTWCGAAVFIGWVGMGFSVGISGFFKFALPGLLFCMLLVYFFAGPLRRQKLFTLADLFGERFGKEAALLPSVLSVFIYAIPTTALQLVGMATIFKICFGVPVQYGIILGGLLLVSFTVLGGLPATIMTDALQSIVLIAGIVILFISVVFFAGGFSEVISITPPEFFTPLGNAGLSGVLLFALSVGPFYLVWQSTWQRMFAARTEQIAKKAGLVGFGVALLISILPYTIGIIARGFVPLDMNPNLIFSYVTAQVLPPYIGGIVFVGLMAALLTGGTSFVMQGSTNIARDLYFKMINPNADNMKMMYVSRISVLIVGLLAIVIALNLNDIVTLYQWALRLTGATLVFPFLATMFWKKATKTGCVASMIIAGVATLLWPYFGINLDAAIFGYPVSLISLVVISLLTNHSASEQVKNVYWESLDSATRKTVSELELERSIN